MNKGIRTEQLFPSFFHLSKLTSLLTFPTSPTQSSYFKTTVCLKYFYFMSRSPLLTNIKIPLIESRLTLAMSTNISFPAVDHPHFIPWGLLTCRRNILWRSAGCSGEKGGREVFFCHWKIQSGSTAAAPIQ